MKFFKKTLENLILISSVALKSGEEQKQDTIPEPTQIYGKAEIYPSKVHWIDGHPVIERNEYMLGKNILGLCNTYSKVIQMLEGLKGRDREKVLEHELGHREFPMRSEAENRRKTYTEEPNMHPMVSYVG